jgi:energy-coupling factor transporter ATP-binding protein EcfA2
MSHIDLPDFKIDPSKIPEVRLRFIHFQNYKAFDDVRFDFTENNQCKSFICFHGPNGSGKTTILETISLIFSRLDGREEDKIKALLGKSVRHIDGIQKAIYNDEDFLITAGLSSSIGDYEVQINKKGFLKNHPPEIKNIVYRLYYWARYDQELHRFQLIRSKWPIFKELFESVTGFKIEETKSIFNESEDPVQSEILHKYVLGFIIHKPDEIISHKECSAGERKIIKSFSTLLNKEYNPTIVCVDNAETHVETGRHIQLIESMKKCFASSQIFVSTHSYQLSRNFGNRSQLYDLRLFRLPHIVQKEPWRLYVADEIRDGISKLKSVMNPNEKISQLIMQGENLLNQCYQEKEMHNLFLDSERFLTSACTVFIGDLVSYCEK